MYSLHLTYCFLSWCLGFHNFNRCTADRQNDVNDFVNAKIVLIALPRIWSLFTDNLRPSRRGDDRFMPRIRQKNLRRYANVNHVKFATTVGVDDGRWTKQLTVSFSCARAKIHRKIPSAFRQNGKQFSTVIDAGATFKHRVARNPLLERNAVAAGNFLSATQVSSPRRVWCRRSCQQSTRVKTLLTHH